MRSLIINDKAKSAIVEVVAHAMQEENYYEPGISNQPPGRDPRHVVLLNTYRCVFSVTKSPDGKLFWHLSISVPAKGKYPNEFAVLIIASLFGFTGWDGHSSEVPRNWIIGSNKEDECAVIAQPFDEVGPPRKGFRPL